ncbi:MAG: hypothetical protein CVV42_10775 [Candidatus Riflebacteria bacterium HGW-Riflebacteria-2]|jgi:hypothetical protein|nr:MAG: hypothetical protein CVV42_10775 [Candidatus Riflebacteria bacterium HGW-Riflebacteria-2]
MPEEKHSPIETIVDWSHIVAGFYADAPVYNANIPETLKHSELYQLLSNRVLLREFCKNNQIDQPSYISGQQFDVLAAWAVKRNRFPLAIKSAINGSDCDHCYVLKAFRELPEFFETITGSLAGPVILEEFISAKSRLEVTYMGGLPRLIAQFGLEKSMRLRHSWRVFPIRPPEALVDQIHAITARFKGLDSIKDVPIRFSFALRSGSLMLLSMNAGLNRLEYHPEWCDAAGINCISAPASKKSSKRICKLLIYHDLGEFAENELPAIGGGSLVKFATAGKLTMALLSSGDTAKLLEDAEKVDAFFRHSRDSDYQPPQPGEEED